MDYFYKNADGDDLIFVHEGTGTLETQFGHLRFREGDYLIIPHGAIWRLAFDALPAKLIWIEAIGGQIETPKRYRNEYGQLMEHSPYCERDIRTPETLETRTDIGDFEVRIHRRGRVYAYHYEHHPFDVVGWDGYVYPWAFNIHDFEPITGRIHMPPPIHQTFEDRALWSVPSARACWTIIRRRFPCPTITATSTAMRCCIMSTKSLAVGAGLRSARLRCTRRAFRTVRSQARWRRVWAPRARRRWR
jgi:homogentisate 1,2-dioxygenase